MCKISLFCRRVVSSWKRVYNSVGICNARDSHENGKPSRSSFSYKSTDFRVRLHVIQSDIKVHCADLPLPYSAIPRILPPPVIHGAIQLWRHRPSPTRSHYTIMNSNRSCKLYLSRGNILFFSTPLLSTTRLTSNSPLQQPPNYTPRA